MPIINVPTCNRDDIQNSIDAASHGDTLIIPSGSVSWTNNLTIAKALRLRFDPLSIITDNYNGDLISITEQTAGRVRVSGGRWIKGTGPDVSFPYHFVKIFRGAADAYGIIWTDSYFDLQYGANAFGTNSNRGVIARNYFTSLCSGGTCGNSSAAVRLKPIGSGDVWNRVHAWGSADAAQNQSLFFETNTLLNVFEGFDVDDNGTAVIRNNTFTNSGIVLHGVDTGWDGARAAEIYNNNLLADMSTVMCLPDLPAGTNSMVRVRSGTIKLHGNVIQDITSMAWGDKSEVSFATDELRRNNGRFPCWLGGYPAFHQTGWGYTVGGTLIEGQYQDLEPCYIWNNTGAGNYNSPNISDYSPNECGASPPTVADYIQIGREIVLSAAPGYTPATYPHPALSEGENIILMGGRLT